MVPTDPGDGRTDAAFPIHYRHHPSFVKLQKLILGLRRLIMELRGLILGLRGLSESLRGLRWGDGHTDGRTCGNSPLCPTGHRPFGAAAQKGGENGGD